MHSLCAAIIACKDLNRILLHLQLAADALLDFNFENSNQAEFEEEHPFALNLRRLAEIKDASSPEALRAAFYASSFQELADTLLSGT